jgi:hypothetical protein
VSTSYFFNESVWWKYMYCRLLTFIDRNTIPLFSNSYYIHDIYDNRLAHHYSLSVMAFTCKIKKCQSVFSDQGSLDKHQKETHLCGINGCRKTFKCPKSRSEHIGDMHITDMVHITGGGCIFYVSFFYLFWCHQIRSQQRTCSCWVHGCQWMETQKSLHTNWGDAQYWL